MTVRHVRNTWMIAVIGGAMVLAACGGDNLPRPSDSALIERPAVRCD